MIAHETLDTNNQNIAYEVSGTGPPLLLLHGFPQCRAMWRPIAARLSQSFTVVCADLRGYGDSSKPTRLEDMSFRHMAADMLALMQHLGFPQFHVAGHDRGGRTAHRLALDHPDAVKTLTVMDIVPTEHLLSNMTTEIAKAYHHWVFLAQPHPFPETMIGHDPDAYFERCLLGFGKARLNDFDSELLTIYRKSWRDPHCIRAMCHDYRAAIEVDWPHDMEDLERKVTCPALVLYGRDGAMAQLLDVPATWVNRLADMDDVAIDGGHFFPDQSPDATCEAMLGFLREHM